MGIGVLGFKGLIAEDRRRTLFLILAVSTPPSTTILLRLWHVSSRNGDMTLWLEGGTHA